MTKGILITIIICITLFLSAIVAGIFASLSKKQSSTCGTDLLRRIINTLWQIPSLLWYPVQAIIEVVHGIAFRFNAEVHNTFKTEDYINNRVQKLIRSSVSSVFHGHSNLLNTYSNRKVAKTLTALLQCISFITTYAGFTFFLGTVNPLAPLFMALVVQGGCYYLLNYAASRKRTGMWKRHVLLFVLLLTSTVTSYIGIFDGVVQPVNIMKDQYEAYAEVVEIIIKQETENTYKSNIDINKIEKATVFINKTYYAAENKIQSLTTQANDINTQRYMQNSYTDENGNLISYTSSVTDIDAQNKKVELVTQAEELKSNLDNLEDYIKAATKASDIYKSSENIIQNSLEAASEEDKNTWNSYVNALYDCYKLYEKLYPDAKEGENEAKTYYESMKIDEEMNIVKNKKEIENLKLETFEKEILGNDTEITESENYTFADILDKVLNSEVSLIDTFNKMVVSKNATEAQEIHNNINEKINDNYTKLFNRINDSNKKHLKSAKEDAIIENPQIMPFTEPFKNKEIIGETIFSLIIAILVDGLSLLIAFALINKQKSILYFEKVVDLRATREEMLEDCLMYICLNDIQNNPTSSLKTDSRAKIQDYVSKKINDVMRDFMAKIHQIYLSDELNSFGYISEDDIKKFNEDEKRLFYTLNNAALVHPCHGSEIIKIINADFDENTTNEPQANQELINKYNNVFSDDKIFYIVSKNLHFWFCENFSELLQNSMFFDIEEDGFDEQETLI